MAGFELDLVITSITVNDSTRMTRSVITSSLERISLTEEQEEREDRGGDDFGCLNDEQSPDESTRRQEYRVDPRIQRKTSGIGFDQIGGHSVSR